MTPPPSLPPTGEGLPEEIRYAIEALQVAAHSGAYYGPAGAAKARSTLDATILHHLSAARARAERAEKAPEFYADPKSFTFSGWQGDMDPPPAFADRGAHARAALSPVAEEA